MPNSLVCTPGPKRGDRVLCADCGRPVSFLRFAFNYKKLRREPYFQTTQGRAILEMLQRRYPRDPRVLNWLLREYRRGRLIVSPQWMTHVQQLIDAEQMGDPHYIEQANQTLDDPNRPDIVLWDQSHMDENGHPAPVQPGIVPGIGQMMDKGVGGKGVDIMKYTYPDFMPQYEKWKSEARERDPNAGEVVHAYPDGWTMRRLSTPQEAYVEGEEMQNCLPKFAPEVNSGKYHLFSLRDHVNAPHANVLIAPRHEGGHWEGGVVRDIRGKQNVKPSLVDPDYHNRIVDWFNHFNEKPSVIWDPAPPGKEAGRPEEYGLSYHPAQRIYGHYPTDQFLDIDDYEQRYGGPQDARPFDPEDQHDEAFGGPNDDPFHEARNAWIFEAARLDELRDPRRRADLATPEGQAILDALERYHSHKNDILMPFLANQWKQGKLHHENDVYGTSRLYYRPETVSPETLTGQVAENYNHYLDRFTTQGYPNPQERAWGFIQRHYPNITLGQAIDQDELDDMGDWLKSKHPTTKGIDLLNKKTTFEDLRAKHDEYQDWLRKKRDQSAIVHKGPNDTYIKRLFSEDLPWEGAPEQMNNCIKDYGYQSDARVGRKLLYSIRDKNGNPHVDIELEPKWWYNPKTRERKRSYELPVDATDQTERGGDWQPVPHEGQIIQIQGKNNEPPHEKYHPLVKDWFQSKHFSGPNGEDWRPTWQLGNTLFNKMTQLYNPGAHHIIYYHPGDYGVENPPVETDYNGMVKTMMVEAAHDPENKRLKHLVQWAKQFGELPDLQQALANPENHAALMGMAQQNAQPENDPEYQQWGAANPEPPRPAGRCPYCGGVDIIPDRYGDGYDMCRHCAREWYVRGQEQAQLAQGPEAEATYNVWHGQHEQQKAEALQRQVAGAWEGSPAAEAVNQLNNMVDYHLGQQPHMAKKVTSGWPCFCNACGGWDFGANDFRIAALIKEANGFNKVRNILKKQNGYNLRNAVALETMRHKFPEHDDMADYLHREFRKGRLNMKSNGLGDVTLAQALENEKYAQQYRQYAKDYKEHADNTTYQADIDYYLDEVKRYAEQAKEFEETANTAWNQLTQKFEEDPEAITRSIDLTVPDNDGIDQVLTPDHVDVIKDIMKKRGQRWQNATPEEQKEWAEADKPTQNTWRDFARQHEEFEREHPNPNDRPEWPEEKRFNKLEQHNIMKTEIPELMDAAKKETIRRRALKLGKVIYTYPKDNWTMRHIDTPEAADVESDMLGHCIRSYRGRIAIGDSLNMSLRDPQGQAHVTFEIKPTKPMQIDWDRIHGQMDKLNAPGQCPECGAMLDDQGICPKCGHSAEVNPIFADYTPEQIEQFKNYHENNQDPYAPEYSQFKTNMLQHGYARPNWLEGNTYQIQGKGNVAPEPKYHPYIREWAESMPYDQRPKSNWSSYFTSQPIMHVKDLQDHVDKVDEMGFRAPNRTINWTSVANSLHDAAKPNWSNQRFNPIVDNPNAQYDPVAGQKAYEFAAANDQMFDLYKAMNQWDKPKPVTQGNRITAECPRCNHTGTQYPDRYVVGMVACSWCGEEYPEAEANFARPNQKPPKQGPQYTPYQAAAVQHIGGLLSQHPELQTLGMHGAEMVVKPQCSHCGGEIQPCQTCGANDPGGPDHGVCANCNNLAYYNRQAQAKVSNLIGHQQPRSHTGTNGQECHCLWHPDNHDLWDNSPHNHRTSGMKTADKFNDFLMQRPDLQDEESQRFLNHLGGSYLNESTDALMPWIVREMKRGRMKVPPIARINGLQYQTPNPDLPWQSISPARLNHWADWYHSNHPTRQGVDIMQMQTPDMHNKIQEWDDAMQAEQGGRAANQGQVVKHWPDGWTIQKLVDEKHLKEEGDKMGHCVGGYGDAVRRGHALIYSLRDPENEPHVTTEITPHWGHCPNCDHKASSRLIECPNCGSNAYQPVPHDGHVVQIQGKANDSPKPEYQQRLKDWFTGPDFEQDGDDQRPTWDDQHISDYDELEDGDGYTQYHEGDYGLDEPDIDHDWEGIIDSMMDHSDDRYVTHDSTQPVVRAALNRGQLDELQHAINNWSSQAESAFEYNFDREWQYNPEEKAMEAGYEPFEDSYAFDELDHTVPCEDCDGTGVVEDDNDDDFEETCSTCGGDGNVENEDFDSDYEAAKDKYYDNIKNDVQYAAWESDPRKEFADNFDGAIYNARHRQGNVTVAKFVLHRNYSTGEPCHCGFVTHFKPLPLIEAANRLNCPTCGDPMEGGYCKRCDWGPHNTAEPMKENPDDVTRDIKGPYQSKLIFPDRWSWAGESVAASSDF